MSEQIERLLVLLKLKEDASQKAYQELLKAQQQYEDNKKRHDQLWQYRTDYMQQLEQLGNDGTVIGRLRNRIDFIHQLDSALLQLNRHLSQLASARSHLQQLYREAKKAEEAVQQLIEKQRKIEAMHHARIEQKEHDEYAQKQWYLKQLNDKTNASD